MDVVKHIKDSNSKTFTIENILLSNAELLQIRTFAVVRICYGLNGEKKYLIKKY